MTIKSMSLAARGGCRQASGGQGQTIGYGFVAAAGCKRKYAIQLLSSIGMSILPKKCLASRKYDEKVR